MSYNLCHLSGSQELLYQWQPPRLGGQDFHGTTRFQLWAGEPLVCRGLTSTVMAEGRTDTLQKVWEQSPAQANFPLNLLPGLQMACGYISQGSSPLNFREEWHPHPHPSNCVSCEGWAHHCVLGTESCIKQALNTQRINSFRYLSLTPPTPLQGTTVFA